MLLLPCPSWSQLRDTRILADSFNKHAVQLIAHDGGTFDQAIKRITGVKVGQVVLSNGKFEIRQGCELPPSNNLFVKRTDGESSKCLIRVPFDTLMAGRQVVGCTAPSNFGIDGTP
jgi:hypothetical protein